MDSILAGLNNAQRDAVTSSASVLQVLAPPGSGKTKTLTARVAYLLSHRGYLPQNVICCTFTIKASREMRERLRGLIGGPLESKLILGTFHSICRRYLVTYGYLIGVPKDFGIADSQDSLAIIKRIVKRLNLTLDPKAARNRISHRKARGHRTAESPKWKKTVENQEFTTVYQEYQTALLTSNLLDYDDLLLRCTDLLRAHPECVSNVQALLIDEFQDTNVVQFELMKLLASKHNRVTIVGDPDQSIYGFRAAEIENLRRMRIFFPDIVVINLEENYRSSSAILRLAQDVVEQDTIRPQKRLKATHCYGTLPVLRKLPTARDEAEWLASEIRRLQLMSGGLLDLSDFAVLLRAAHLSRLIEAELGKMGMAYRMVGGHRFFDREEIRILLGYLRTISQPDNDAAFVSIINVPSRKIGEETVKELLKLGEEKVLSVWAVAQKVLRGDLILQRKLSKPAEQGLGKLVSLVKDAKGKMKKMIPDRAPLELLEYIVTKLSFEEYLKKKHPEDDENRWENVEELLTQADELANGTNSLAIYSLDEELPEIEGLERQQLQGSEEALSSFLASISLSADVQAAEDGVEKQCITISTIHAAKGLEWPAVFIPAVYDGSIPHSRSEDMDEERRLLYVAMTRAQALLYLSTPLRDSRENVETALSQFLPATLRRRLSEHGADIVDNVVSDAAEILRRPCPPQQDLVKGMLDLTSDGTSTKDDVWPIDGTSRPTRNRNREAALPAQTDSFSTTAGFTTAGQHLKSLPARSDQAVVLRRDSSFSRDTRAHSTSARVKKVKAAGPQQTSMSGFLTTQATVAEASRHLASSNHCRAPHEEGDDEPFLPALPKPTSATGIPRGLSCHQSANLAMSTKRPRTVLEDSPNTKKNRYVFLSSSPNKDDRCPKNTGNSQEDASTSFERYKEAAMTGPRTSVSVSGSMSTTVSNYKTATTMHTTSMSILERGTAGNRTYGVRRTIGNSGWDTRKHK